MVVRHAVLLNPAASVRGEKYQVVEEKTPEISIEQARTLIASIRLAKTLRNGDSVPDIVGLRDWVIIGVLIYTAARRRLYDRRQKRVTRNIVERISV